MKFDSFGNPEWDPSFPHVGINNGTIGSAVFTSWNASLHSGTKTDVLITYNASTKNLSVSWNYGTSIPSISRENGTSLSYQIDLRKALPEWVTVGFSAATGKMLRNTHFIHGSSIPPWKWKISSTREGLTRELVLATNNFSNDRKLGEGGFGVVYRGYITDLDATVAVKQLSKGSKQGKKEYLTEVKIISSLRHGNVQFIGWSHDKGEFLLVYEFMPNGSLDTHIFGNRSSFTWAVRYKIALGLASALLYLHEEWEQCVVHRDIKSSNVMLHSGSNVKLGEFGSRLMFHELSPRTTGLAGT